MQSSLQNFQKVYQMLRDEQSRYVYLKRLDYLISNDYRHIKEIVPSNLAYSDLGNRFAFFGEVLSKIPEDAKIVLYGSGSYPMEHLLEWNGDRRIIGFCSNNAEKQRIGYLGYPVMGPEELAGQRDYYVIVSVVQAKPKEEILCFLEEAEYPKEKIFYHFEQEREPGQYFDTDFMEFGDHEVFVDAGSCNLDTSLEFRKRCPNLKKVYAFEPDPDNYNLCVERKKQAGFDEADIFPYGTWDKDEMLHFNVRGTGGTCITEGEGMISLPVRAIDEVIPSGEKVTFIKMDVEGAELKSLKGCQKIIQRDRPKLAICIYHKPDDMVEIPLYIKELVPEYKLYVRHHSNCEWETVLYAMP